MDNHHGGNVKMNNPDGKRLDFLFRSNYLSFCFRAAARHMRRLLSWVSWPLGLVRRWGDVGSSSSDDVMHTGSTELVKIVSKYWYLFLQIPLPSPQYRRSSRSLLPQTGSHSHCCTLLRSHMQTWGPRPGQASGQFSWSPDSRGKTRARSHYTVPGCSQSVLSAIKVGSLTKSRTSLYLVK